MRLLLHTHTFIWWSSASENLSTRVRSLLEDDQSLLHLSVVSVWEIQIKVQIGKLNTREPLATTIAKQQQQNNLQIVPVNLQHTLTIANLPLHHKDPFDRMLVAQAKIEDLTLVTHDDQLSQYPIKTVW